MKLDTGKILLGLLGVGALIALTKKSFSAPITSPVASWKISIGHEHLVNYGLSYPVTYKFSIPLGSSNLRCFKTTSDSWIELPIKTSNDFFNGEECVRFDYINNLAYVSVTFGSDSNEIYLFFTNLSGDNVPVNFISICPYYDDRRAVVTASFDDWVDDYTNSGIIKQFAERKIWLTGGAALMMLPTWSTLQYGLDLGYFEIANHSQNHQAIPYTDYDLEIIGSKNNILNNLTLPSLYKRGSVEYIPSWLEPNGASSEVIRSKLGMNHYLADRSADENIVNWASWDYAHGLYNRIGYTKRIESESESSLKSSFDTQYTNGKIWHLQGHPSATNWLVDQKAKRVLDYIANKLDIWYVGFGAMHMYHYVQERGVVTVQSVST